MSAEITREEALALREERITGEKKIDEKAFNTLVERICSSKGITSLQLTGEFQVYREKWGEIFNDDEKSAKWFFLISEAAKIPQIEEFIQSHSDKYGETSVWWILRAGMDCAERRGVSYPELAGRVKEYADLRPEVDMYRGAFYWFLALDGAYKDDPNWYKRV